MHAYSTNGPPKPNVYNVNAVIICISLLNSHAVHCLHANHNGAELLGLKARDGVCVFVLV